MNLLAIESATENCSVAMCRGEETAVLSEILANGHSRRVHGMIAELCEKLGMGLHQLDGIVADTGPGSFTGLRIGIGIAQGLAYGSGLKTLGVSSLAALAAACSGGYVISAIDARMGQVYWNVFDTSGLVTPVTEARVCDPELVAPELARLIEIGDIDVQLPQKIIAAGAGWQTYSRALPDVIHGCGVQRASIAYPSAKELLAIARQHGTDALAPPELLAASYVRNDVAKKA